LKRRIHKACSEVKEEDLTGVEQGLDKGANGAFFSAEKRLFFYKTLLRLKRFIHSVGRR
jgi:hypothetical protein